MGFVDVSICAFSRRETNEVVKIRRGVGLAQNPFCLMLVAVSIYFILMWRSSEEPP